MKRTPPAAPPTHASTHQVKTLGAVSLALLLACLLPLGAFAQTGAGAEWEKLGQESARQYRMGNYANSLEAARKMLELA